MFLTQSMNMQNVFVESPQDTATHVHDTNTGTIVPVNESKGTDNDNIPQTKRE